jgi:mannitol-1-/sugar-/sorbitol-6-phosphatase
MNIQIGYLGADGIGGNVNSSCETVPARNLDMKELHGFRTWREDPSKILCWSIYCFRPERSQRRDATIENMGELVSLRGKAVLFDMDGTLVDSTQVVERAWGSWALRHNIPLKDVLSFSHGRPTISTLEHFLPGCDHAAELEELAHFEETQTDGILAVAGATHVLHALQAQNHPWAVVTSAWRKLAEIRIMAAGLPLPTVIVPIDEIRNGKPSPEGFLSAAAHLGVAPQECIVFEDTRPGIDAGLNGGMQVVGLLTTCSSEQLRHRPLICDFRNVEIRTESDFLTIALRDESLRDDPTAGRSMLPL